jgi:hypothetical protein
MTARHMLDVLCFRTAPNPLVIADHGTLPIPVSLSPSVQAGRQQPLRARLAPRSTNTQRWEPPITPSLAVGAQQSHAQMPEGAINPPRHGRSDQLYASPMSMDTMPMFLYPGTPSTPQCSNLSQYPYDNLRIPPTLDNNYLSMSPHYEVHPAIHLVQSISESVQCSFIRFIRFNSPLSHMHR